MSIPYYVMALANHQGPAHIKAGGLSIPVKIGGIDHESDGWGNDSCKFECIVVNPEDIRKDSEAAIVSRAKSILNSIYGANPAPSIPRSSGRYPWGHFCIKDVKFGKSTTVIWKNDEKTSIVCPDGPAYSKETSLAMCFSLRQQGIASVIFNNPHTIVNWEDGTKTIVRCQEGDVYSKETGLALCIAKKVLGNKGGFNDVFHEWIPEEATGNE